MQEAGGGGEAGTGLLPILLVSSAGADAWGTRAGGSAGLAPS